MPGILQGCLLMHYKDSGDAYISGTDYMTRLPVTHSRVILRQRGVLPMPVSNPVASVFSIIETVLTALHPDSTLSKLQSRRSACHCEGQAEGL